jgi:nondiscriminating glutamyl-tRNA synthetase
MKSNVRVRFAPSPTGEMHLGNIRVALFNYLFAKQKSGTFVLRIEDTDQQRNVELAGKKIIEDLKWIGLSYDEGPIVGGEFGPYLQSERVKIYQEKLDELISNQNVYRCFCTAEELEEKRKHQLAVGQPPRYAETCRNFSDDMIEKKLEKKMPFIWRLKINHKAEVDIVSMARGKMHFEMKNYADFALTRPDGSFTFMFANFVDDWLMKISHVIRGEDHLTNTAMQGALFHAFAVLLPTFWHLPIMCNTEGKKLSKRDFGFALKDLQQAGFLPQAICNYLVTVGYSFKDEVQSLEELAKNFNFEHLHSSGAIRYDVEKLTWFNHKWIERLDSKILLNYAKPFLYHQLPQTKTLDDEKLAYLVGKVKTDAKTLNDFGALLTFYFQEPDVKKDVLDEKFGKEKVEIILQLISDTLENTDKADVFLDVLKSKGKELNLKSKEFFGTFRYILSGRFQGLSMHDLLDMLDWEVIKSRINKISF